MTVSERTPTTTIQHEFSSDGATATDWSEGRSQLASAEIYWLATIRPEGRPHVAPLMAILDAGTIFFVTGESERKAKNLAQNPHCIILTGTNLMTEGLDVVVEGDAVVETDDAVLHRIADAYVAKYGEDWRYVVHDGAFHHGEGSIREGEYTGKALVFRIAPQTAFGFGRGASFSQTRWRF